MHTPGRALMHHRLISLAVATLLTLITSLASAAVPSTDRDHPTPLTSNEIRGTSGGKAGDYYYTFIAGPGEVALTVDATAGSDARDWTQPWTTIQAELFDMNANQLLSQEVTSWPSRSERKVGRVKIPNRQPLVLRVRLDGNTKTSRRCSRAHAG